jgi:hypothetical protein
MVNSVSFESVFKIEYSEAKISDLVLAEKVNLHSLLNIIKESI